MHGHSLVFKMLLKSYGLLNITELNPPPTLSRIVMALQLVETLHSVSIVAFVSIKGDMLEIALMKTHQKINCWYLTVSLPFLFSRLKFRSYVLNMVTKKSRFSSHCGWFIQGEFLMVLENNEENRFRSVISRS